MRLVASKLHLRLVREPPFPAVVTEAQQFTLAAQLLAGKIVQGVDLVRGRRLFLESQIAQLLSECFEIRDEKFYFNFLRSRHKGSVNQWIVDTFRGSRCASRDRCSQS